MIEITVKDETPGLFAKKEIYRGYISSKREYFFDVRAQVITTIDGSPMCRVWRSCRSRLPPPATPNMNGKII